MPSLMYMYGYVAPKLLARLKRPLAAEHAFHELRKLPTVCSVTGCDAPLNLSRPSSAEPRGAGNRTRAFRTHQLLRPKSNNNNQLWTHVLHWENVLYLRTLSQSCKYHCEASSLYTLRTSAVIGHCSVSNQSLYFALIERSYLPSWN